jgi:hypothetical protein
LTAVQAPAEDTRCDVASPHNTRTFSRRSFTGSSTANSELLVDAFNANEPLAHDTSADLEVTPKDAGFRAPANTDGIGFAEYADCTTLTLNTWAAVRSLVTPKDAGRTIAVLGHISHDANACAEVVPKHGGMPDGGGFAEYADSTLAVDTVAVRVGVTPNDTGRKAHVCFSHDAEARAGVNPFHGGRTVRGRFAPYAD